MLTSLHCLWKAQTVSSLDENIYFLSNESHPQCTVTCDYESTDLLSSSPTAHAVSSHSFHPLPWDMFIICVSPADPFTRSLSVSTSEVDGNTPLLQWQQQHGRSIAFLATYLLGAQFSSCSESQCITTDHLGHWQVFCPLEHNIYIRAGGFGGLSRALSRTRMTLKRFKMWRP